MNTPFPALNDWIAPPPLPAVLAILMVLGFKHLGGHLCRLLFRSSKDSLNAAASFVLVVSLVAAVLQALLVFWRLPVQALRSLAWTLAALGLVESWLICRGVNFGSWKRLTAFLFEQRSRECVVTLLLLANLVCLLFLALAPATDADSLDYHLGVPVDLLRKGEAYPRYDWFHARLAGSGELLNMLGLAGGTDILGAALSAAGILALLITLAARFGTGRDRTFVLGSILSCPFLLFLLPNQKPFLFPAVANTLALLVISERFRSLDGRSLFLAFGCCFLAMSCKYSFLLSGGVVLVAGMVAARISGRLVAAIGTALLLYLVMIFPMELQKFQFYGDPISPMLEEFRQHGDAALARFAHYIRYYSMSTLPFPLSIVAPDTPGRVSSVLGVGVFACVATLFAVRRSPVLLSAACGAMTISYLAGARSAGYYLEPYVWLCIAAAYMPWNRFKSVVWSLLALQAAAMLVFAGFGAIRLFPGALTAGLRDQVMTENAYQYSAMRWLDRELPKEAVVLSMMRSHALMPRPFVAKDVLTWTDWASSTEVEKTASLLDGEKLNALVAEPVVAKTLMERLDLRSTAIPVKFKRFSAATRNPWNRSPETNLAVYGIGFAAAGTEQADSLRVGDQR